MSDYRIPDDMRAWAETARGRLHLWDAFAGSRTALVVVDMQNYFVAPSFLGECKAARAIVPTVNRLGQAVREAGGRVVWIANTSSDTEESWSVRHAFESPERSRSRLDQMRLGTEGCEIWRELDVRPEDGRLFKTRYSACLQGSSELPSFLRENGLDTVLIAGTYTNVCCQTSAQDAMMLNFQTVMVSDCCAGSSPEAHAAALTNFFRFFGDVLTADEVVERLRRTGTEAAAA